MNHVQKNCQLKYYNTIAITMTSMTMVETIEPKLNPVWHAAKYTVQCVLCM